jgi:hypothetical protein
MWRRAWSAYNRSLERRPLFTKCCMSGVILGSADALVQTSQDHGTSDSDTNSADSEGFDWRRAGAVQVFSFCFQGPFGHFWYPFLDRNVRRLGLTAGAGYIATKVFFDETVNGNVTNALYFSSIPLMEGKELSWVKEKMRYDLLPSFLIEGALWIPASTFNFLFIPLPHQLMFANCVVFVWTAFLSVVCHDDQMLRGLDWLNPFLTAEEKAVSAAAAAAAAAAATATATTSVAVAGGATLAAAAAGVPGPEAPLPRAG